MTTTLSSAALPALRRASILRTSKCAALEVPGYDRASVKSGIVHMGVGQFHRSHMALYTDMLLASEEPDSKNWGICGVGLMPSDAAMRDSLERQDYLYSLITRGADSQEVKVIGSHVDNLVAPEDPSRVLAKLADTSTNIVSLTVTEKGYCHDPVSRELNLEHPLIAHDLEPGNHDSPKSAVGYLAHGLEQRMLSGSRPFSVLSCDNIQCNGDMLRELVCQYVSARTLQRSSSPGLESWIKEHASFPNTMVDRITPGASKADIKLLAETYDLADSVPVSAEPFLQWVVQDSFVEDARPKWERVGALFSSDVAPYEKMKLRLLNAGHSVLAYSGLLCKHTLVHEAMGDELVSKLVSVYMDEVTPTVPEVPGVDLTSYKSTLAQRFANPSIADAVLRLAEDGSQKMAGFVAPSVRDLLATSAAGASLPASQLAAACWIKCLGTAEIRAEMKEPREVELGALAEAAVHAPTGHTVQAFLESTFGGEVAGHDGFRGGVCELLQRMQKQGSVRVLTMEVAKMSR
eukprot:TRINITY_DN27425_c0_g1_i2.p1 TRINITY_DN27425_c0_g1~~TRINITY_DN27425_c0_g1_i2.p1  ORF type:complete len:519 (+),score=125.45 TRINITY_DN27425_c0_g1_i2:155-1711(+)